MDIPTRALAVDDEKIVLGQIESALSDCGYEVDTASDYETARSLIIDKFYHFVATDLALDPRDHSNRDGMLLIRDILGLNEGTSYIALSGYGKMKEGSEARELGALAVIDKDTSLRTQIRNIATEHLQQQKLNLSQIKYGVEFLSANEESRYWIDRALRALKPREGYPTLDKLAADAFKNFGPLLYPQNDPTAHIDESDGTITGTYWSKMFAIPIFFKLGNNVNIYEEVSSYKNNPEEFKRQGLTLLRSKDRQNIGAIVYSNKLLSRNDFVRQL